MPSAIETFQGIFEFFRKIRFFKKMNLIECLKKNEGFFFKKSIFQKDLEKLFFQSQWKILDCKTSRLVVLKTWFYLFLVI